MSRIKRIHAHKTRKKIRTPPALMQFEIKRTPEEIAWILEKADRVVKTGNYLARYAEGVESGLRWLFGEYAENPMQD